MAGFWEFPGGKRRAGESRLDALRRELDEEIGIEVLTAAPWLDLVHDYPDKRVRLDVWRVHDFRGEVVAREGQQCRWVTAAELEEIGLLAADRPIVDALRSETAEPTGDSKSRRS